MRVYRFVSTRFPDGLSWDGARRNGGRWNSKGVPVVYCATSESLALLELRVHAPHPYPRTRWRLVIEVSDDAVQEVRIAALPRGWNRLPPSPANKRFGDEWVAAGSSLGLLVPSVVATDERNLLLNPEHTRFREVRVVKKTKVRLDARLYGTGRRRSA